MPRKNPIPVPPPFDPEAGTEPIADDASGTYSPGEEPVIESVSGEVEDAVPQPSPTRALVSSAADHHLVVGMATLANMSEDEFTAKLDVMKRGQERLRTIQENLLVPGEDYGRVRGIDKPFLHQPGAEKLANFYGLAVRQEATRVTRQVGDDPETPPYSYQVQSFVHLGSFDGPIVATGFGEANPFEEKYRYRWAKSGCPVCGMQGTIITRKSPPALAGKRQCANFGDKAGCGTVFEANDPRLKPSEKEENPDLYGLAETILAMAAKRSLVASVRRATGTSGLFTQDEDSPSVQQQSQEAGPEGQAPVVESATIGVPIEVGGKTTQVTQAQLDRLQALAKEKGIGGAKIAELLNRLFDMEVAPTGKAASEAVRTLDANQMGQLLMVMDTGELPNAVTEATYPDDIGAK